MLKAIIFDMDGVIIDSEPLHARANIQAMKKFGLDITMEYVSQFIGNTILYMCETIRNDFGLELSSKELSAEIAKQIDLLHEIEGYTPVPYVKELIQDLHRHGLKLAIASSSTPELIKRIADIFELTPYFDCLVSGLSVPNSKPAPDIFLKACEELKVSPDEAIIIEDSMNGVLAATRANITAIGLQNPNSGNQDLSKAYMIVESFEEIDSDFISRAYCHSHNLPSTIADTKRLCIRELSPDDAPDLFQLYQDPTFLEHNLKFASTLKETYELQEAYIKHMYHFTDMGLWGVFLKETGQLIGHCGIEPKTIQFPTETKDIYELGYGICQSMQHKGYATEAVHAILAYAQQTLCLCKLHVVIDSSNTTSLAFAKKMGFHNDVTFLSNSKQDNSSTNSNRSMHLLELELRLTNE